MSAAAGAGWGLGVLCADFSTKPNAYPLNISKNDLFEVRVRLPQMAVRPGQNQEPESSWSITFEPSSAASPRLCAGG